MAKAVVERYEQILSQDPSSAVFVELAKALIDRGDHQRAIEVCQSGLTHHPDSVVGRVLYGKALIFLGRPAEAMGQFDQAIAIDKGNAHPYILISEVLLRRGLFRSALPLLRKAAQLRPNDARVQRWLSDTQAAMTGGPAPKLDDGEPELVASSVPETDPEYTPTVQARPGPPISADALPTQVLQAYDPSPQEPARTQTIADPFSQVAPVEPTTDEVMPGMTATFDALTHQAATASPPVPPPRRPTPPPRKTASALLEDIPEIHEPAPEPVRAPVVSTQFAERAAKEFERELLEKLETNAQKSFLSRHGGKLALLSVVGFALVVGLGVFFFITKKHDGKNLAGALAEARKLIGQDTHASYSEALRMLDLAREMDEQSTELWALTGYAHAVLYAEHGRTPEDNEKARAALERAGVRAGHPGYALAVDYLVADGAERDEKKREVLSSKEEDAVVLDLAGRILLAQGDSKGALGRLERALRAVTREGNVRPLLALGAYYQRYGDHAKALEFFTGPTEHLSPKHPERILGAAESRLDLGQDIEVSGQELKALASEETLAPELAMRRELVHGRVLSALGQHEDAISKLQHGSRQFKPRAFDFHLALGDACRSGGRMFDAERAYEEALRLRPANEEALEGLGRALIAQDRESEATRRLDRRSGRKVALVRAIALSRLEQWSRARSELAKTELDGKFPVEALVYLALADEAAGKVSQAQTVLESALSASKRARGEIRVALGHLYWRKGVLDKARAQFTEAMKESSDYEAPCALGRLLLSLELPALALDPLQKSVVRNDSHGEARHALGRALLAAGRRDEALVQFQARTERQPRSAQAHQDVALAERQLLRLTDAERSIVRAIRLDGKDPEAFRIYAQVLFAKGDATEATRALERSNRLDPKNAETFCEIGMAYVRQGSSSAPRAFEAALRNRPQSRCGKLGLLYVRASRAKSVQKELTELAKTAPYAEERALASAILARALASSAPGEARAAAEQAVATAPYLGVAHLALGQALSKAKDEAGAIAALTKAVELDPALAEAHLTLAELLARSDDTAQAALERYQAFLRFGADPKDKARVQRLLGSLKKKLAVRSP